MKQDFTIAIPDEHKSAILDAYTAATMGRGTIEQIALASTYAVLVAMANASKAAFDELYECGEFDALAILESHYRQYLSSGDSDPDDADEDESGDSDPNDADENDDVRHFGE